jgi:3-oxoacyl-[acyl-carrier-protein] synthase-3
MIFSKIIGTGCYLPKKFISNDDISKILDTSDEWITTRTGIKNRHIAADDENTSDLATMAVKRALKDGGLIANDLDAIILATTTPDIIFPASATKIQHNIGMTKGFAFDVQAVCSGFLYALLVADSFLKTGKAKRVAVIGAEVMSRIVDWKDRNTCVLFGDGSGAVILEQCEGKKNNGIIDIDLYSDGQYIDMLLVNGSISKENCSGKIEMNGREVFRHAVTKMMAAIKSIVHKNNLELGDLDWLLLHQANDRIIRLVAEKLGVEQHKAISMVHAHANTSAASIPLALDHSIKEQKIKRGDLIALSAIGGGLTWGSALLKL